MSYEAYVHHILQKHHLAISLAVINTKPDDITLEEHIKQLRNMIKGDEMEEDNLSICSTDFNIDENNDHDMNFDQNNDVNDLFLDLTEENQSYTENVIGIINTQDINNIDKDIDRTQVPESRNEEHYETDHRNETNDEEMIDTQNLNDSITILASFDVKNELEELNITKKERNSSKDAMGVLRGIDNNMTTIEQAVANKIPAKLTREISQTQVSEDLDVTQCYTDIDATQCESFDILVGVDDHLLSQKQGHNGNGNNQSGMSKKYQESKKRIVLVTNYEETNVNKSQCDNGVIGSHNFTKNSGKKSQTDTKEKDSDLESKLKNLKSKTCKLKDLRHTKEFKNVYKNVADIFDNKNKKNISKDVKEKRETYKTKIDETTAIDPLKNVVKNSQDILNHNITQDFTSKTHYSQSQTSDMVPIDKNLIHGIKRNTNIKNKGEKKKKKKEVAIIVEDEVIINTKKQATNAKDASNDDDIFSQEIQVAKVSTEKSDNWQKLKNNNEKHSNEADARTTANILQESQITDSTTPINSNQIFTENNEDFLKYKINNAVNTNNRLDANDSMFCNKDMLYANDSMLNANNNTLNTNNSTSSANNETLHIENSLNANDILLNQIIQNQNNTMLNANNIEYNAKNEGLFSEESQMTVFSYSSDAFQNIFSDGSLGFTHSNFGTKHYRVVNNEMSLRKSCAAFDKDSQRNSTNFDNPQNNQADNKNDNSENASEIENKKSCADFDDNNSMAVHMNTEIDEHNDMQTGFTNSDDNLDEEFTDPEIEKIPFKIIEELNKVKMFLNKRYDKNLSSKGYSSDTGYRSESSSKNSSLRCATASQSNIGLDQSAHSLFNYITECPLVATTQGITEEISLILGQLIDKLHEEEKYPSFLEDMLQSIQQMLGLIYENSDENMLTKKDESIYRIILLNKSIHIQKYTIEKITHILEKIHTELTTNASFETQNIDQTENICYIFHLLEIILQKHNKTSQKLSQSSQNLSQSTQNLSQNTQEDEKSLKKSDIMDLWRKKWNPNYKEIQNEGSQEKKCVLNDCTAVLNMLIVGCMEGYSLISYFALKCFNVMQN